MTKFRADSRSLQSHSITIIADISGADQRRQRCEIGGTRCDISCQSSYMAVGHGTDCTPACGRHAARCITGSSLTEAGWMRFACKQLQMKHKPALLFKRKS